jgi:hypothetical protein
MTNIIRWSADKEFSEDVIKILENYWKIKFPKEYIDIVTKHDGSQPDVMCSNKEWKRGFITIQKCHDEKTGFAFLRYTNAESIEQASIFIAYKAFKDCLPDPEKIFPFADDGGGNIYFFDYRKNSCEPAIVFLDHEQAITEEDLPEEDLKKKPLYEWLDSNLYHVCNSFSELLDMIHPANFN